ncbi:hypothetical protein AB4Z22_41485, partial [Paenibacillus sp. TAF58]
RRGCGLHDPLAAALLAGGLSSSRSAAVIIDVDVTDGPDRGRTLALGEAAPAESTRPVTVVLETDLPLAPHLMERVLTTFG